MVSRLDRYVRGNTVPQKMTLTMNMPLDPLEIGHTSQPKIGRMLRSKTDLHATKGQDIYQGKSHRSKCSEEQKNINKKYAM